MCFKNRKPDQTNLTTEFAMPGYLSEPTFRSIGPLSNEFSIIPSFMCFKNRQHDQTNLTTEFAMPGYL